MTTTTETALYHHLRSERRAKLWERVAVRVSAVLCAVILVGVVGFETITWLEDAGSVPARGVMDAGL